MKITFVNHAGFIIESSGIKMICDPWIEGRSFDNGWELLVASEFSYDDFSTISHIWFSHDSTINKETTITYIEMQTM